MGKWWEIAAAVGVVAILREVSKKYGWEKEAGVRVLGEWSEQLGIWAIPLYVLIHALTIALCLPYAIFFEAVAAILFGFLPAVLCVFAAKLLGASLSFWIGRYVASAIDTLG